MSDGFSMKVDEGDLRQLLGKLDGLGDLDISRALMAGGLVVEGAGKALDEVSLLKEIATYF